MLRSTLLLLLLVSTQAAARNWSEEKCARYGEAWTQELRRQGSQGLSAAFLDAHASFLTSGCRERAACPRSAPEIAMADLMTIRAVNAGMSGTFLPFICRAGGATDASGGAP